MVYHFILHRCLKYSNWAFPRVVIMGHLAQVPYSHFKQGIMAFIIIITITIVCFIDCVHVLYAIIANLGHLVFMGHTYCHCQLYLKNCFYVAVTLAYGCLVDIIRSHIAQV